MRRLDSHVCLGLFVSTRLTPAPTSGAGQAFVVTLFAVRELPTEL